VYHHVKPNSSFLWTSDVIDVEFFVHFEISNVSCFGLVLLLLLGILSVLFEVI